LAALLTLTTTEINILGLLDDPLFLLFMLVLVVVIAGVVICLVAIFGHAGTASLEREQRKQSIEAVFSLLEKIAQYDEDYKALVESYLRETGKVYVRPARVVNEKLQPPAPSPFRFKPPTWAPTPKPKDIEKGEAE